ncbi:MAG: Tm-1-like ATP-binding domain-containing protein, partial [Candidatus Humimicrobiaceae bacterium]
TGGQAMEQLIKEGMINGVLDLATIEVVQELLGGYLAATSERMTVAARMGIPQIICPGAVSVNTYGPPETIPDKFKDRAMVCHSPLFTNVRVNAEEMKKLAKEQAGRVGKGKELVEWFVPMEGFCSYSIKGQPLYDSRSDKAYLESLKKELNKDIPIHVRETDINDPAFATEIAEHLIKLMNKKYN